MNVLSLFDGMSCGRIALERAGKKVDKYYASEIDKYAIKVSQANYPDIIQMGDITKWREWDIDWSSIDFVCAGSPCQGFSLAGKQLAFNDPRSALFFEFLNILNHVKTKNKDVVFFLENVKMKKEYLDTITSLVGVEPICINSALVSAQNRVRYYWTNIEGVEQPEDRGILLKDVLLDEDLVDEKYYIKNPPESFNGMDVMKKARTLRVGGQLSMTDKHNYDIVKISKKGSLKRNQDKASCLTGGGNSGGNHSDMDIICVAQRGRNKDNPTSRESGLPTVQMIEPRADSKTNCLTTVGKDNLLMRSDFVLRRLTPTECERLQNVPDGYTSSVSNTQRYKMLGNGWNVNTIEHFFMNL